MAVPLDPLGQGPLPPRDAADPLPAGELDPSERKLDPGRSEADLMATESRPLTVDEQDAAREDSGRDPRTYAPHSERVPKAPLPADEELVEGTAKPVETDEGTSLR